MIQNLLASLLLTAISSPALACQDSSLSGLMESMKSVGFLHNCRFEVVSRDESNGTRKYMMWVQDRRASQDANKRTVTFEFETPKACLSSDSMTFSPESIQSSFGYDSGGVRFRTALTIRLSPLGNPKSLLLQDVNLSNGEITKRVLCQPNRGVE